MAQHLARTNTPKNWPIARKKTKWITRVNPGTHPKSQAINISVLVRDFLRYAATSREIRRILQQGKIVVNTKIRRDPRFPLGIMDVIEIPSTQECYRLLLNPRGRFSLAAIPQDQQKVKPCKVINKTLLRGSKMQLNLFDGRNILHDDPAIKPGDTIILDLSKNQVQQHLKFEKDALIYLTRGRKTGMLGTLKEIVQEKNMIKPKIIIESGQEKVQTLKEYAFVIDKKFMGEGKPENGKQITQH